jgi:glycosyltransferase involved in cell wall biosynthesis
MRILRIVTAGYEQGGAENGIVLTNEILRNKGHDVRVISGNARPDLPHYSDYEFAEVPAKGLSRLTNAVFNTDAYRVTKKTLDDFKPDVVLLHTMSQPTAAIWFLLKKYPTIQFVHGPEIFTKSLLPWYLAKRDYKHGKFVKSDLTAIGRLHYYYFRYICYTPYKMSNRNIDAFLALSTYTQSFLEKEGITARYMPNGVKVLTPAPLPSAPVLLYAGRLEKFKGVDDLLKAMPDILRSHPDVKLRIAGEGSYEQDLRKLVTELGLTESVTFLGHLDKKAMAAEYRRCSLFVMPSTWPETFGKVGVEAMSVGRPVIATDVGGVRDWLTDGENGYLIEPHRHDQIAEKVTELLNSPESMNKMSTAGIATAKKFSIEAMATNIESLAKEIA